MKTFIFRQIVAATTTAIIFSTLGACTTINHLERASSSEGETAAQAAVFRYIFTSNSAALKDRAATYCIDTGSAVSPRDPKPDLLSLLSDVRPAVQPISACRTGERVIDGVGRPALLFHLETTECDGITTCLFRGGYYEGNLSASSAIYRARLIDGHWQVSQEGPIAVS